uniref:Uncharacterized protein n=1 Tax=Cannabis sativa TaxID=3483 RepID=A0A803R915_CANSA
MSDHSWGWYIESQNTEEQWADVSELCIAAFYDEFLERVEFKAGNGKSILYCNISGVGMSLCHMYSLICQNMFYKVYFIKND